MTAIQALRKELKQYVDSADEKALRIVKALLEIEQEDDEDWEDSEVDWDELPEELQLLIEKGIKEADEGKGIPHEEVVKMYPQWFKK
jgi:predicted transcriptional regulator